MRTRSSLRPPVALVAAFLCIAAGTAFAQQPPRGGPRRLPGNRPLVDGKAPAPGAQNPTPAPGNGAVPGPTPPQAPGAPAPAMGNGGAPAGGDQLPGEVAATRCQKLRAGVRYRWDQRGEIDLANLLAWAQSSFCIPIIVPANLRQQKITIYAPGEMTSTEMYRMFYSALNAMGLTVQSQGPRSNPSALVIIETNRAKESPIPVYGPDERLPSNDQFITRVQRLEHVSVEEVLPVLTRIKSAAGDVVAAPPSTLIITDIADNIRRMDMVLQRLDTPSPNGERIWVVKLHAVGATEMANMLNSIFVPKGGAQPGQRRGAPQMGAGPTPAPGGEASAGAGGSGDMSVSQIIAEDRSNTLIIVCGPRAYQLIRGLIDRLDQQGGPMDAASDRVHVYFLANANADELAGVLSSLGISVSRGAGGRPGAPGSPVTSSTTAPGGLPQPGQAGSLFEQAVKVAPDKATNSLIIVASGKDYLTIRDLIRKLDITRRQVFIEATILEVSLDKARKLGMAFHGGSTVFGGQDQSLLFGGSEPSSNVNSILFSPAALSGLAAGLRGPAIPGADKILGLPPGQSIPAFGVFVQALQNNNDVNVVSLPHILTSDNEKATIQVGQNLPFPGSLGVNPLASALGSAAGGSTAALGLGFGTSVQRQDVALKLEVTPHVNDSDFVRLEVDNEISDVSSPNYNGLGPATDKRTVKTVISVRDMQSVVLGGLVKDKITETVDKVPLLGDIPILGYLFKYTTKTIQKQNLLIILTPYVIKDPSDLRRIFERKIQERREFLERNSAFTDNNDYEAHIDFRKKRGLLEEINRTAAEAELEARELRKAEESMHRNILDGPVEPAPLPPPPPRVVTPPAVEPATPAPPAPQNNFGGERPPTEQQGTAPPGAMPSEAAPQDHAGTGEREPGR